MGNQLVGIAPSQIFPVEHYLTEHSDLQFDINLGSTRFLKVARAKSQEGLVVVKVFAIHDPSLPLTSHKDRAQQITNELSVNSSVNCLPFQKAVLSDKAGFLIREYVKFSLYDRISTRPFLAPIEKKWIAFQLLYALHQCHKSGVCHGDIKMENVTVTSWHWVLLTDFASFKPTHLPEDNPADFSYFFDTSRRRTCYIAPERFVKTLGSDANQLLLPEVNVKEAHLQPSMDIFSAGCVLAELFSDGHPPFDFSQLLAYRNGEYSLDKYMKKIDDPEVRELIKAMIQKEPTQRVSAELYLDQERGKLFPGYFYSFLHSYMLIFSASSPILSPDEKIERLRKDINNIISLLINEEDGYYASRGQEKKTNYSCEALLLVTSLVTSCIRGLHFTNSKLQCLEILLELSAQSSSETILDRILPFIMHLIHDPFARVRVSAIHTLNKVLKLVKTVPPSDANVFPEYILPGLAVVTHDEAVIVRTAFAENVADLAETALRLLEYWQVNPLESPRRSYESELATLHEMVQQMAASLLTDSQNIVKQTLIENGITKLCVFFGKQKSNDVLLSHMITFLNDKDDKQLRGSFFDCIVGVAAFVGIHCSPILSPLLHQGLTDPEEFVARKAINAITALTELSLLHKYALYHLLEESACLLAHPNLWIRQAVVGFVSALARTLNIVDVQCKVMSVIEPYLRTPVIQLEREVLVLNGLKPCIPRLVYDTVAKCSELQLVLQSLIDRHKARQVQHTHVTLPTALPGSPHQNNTIRNLFGRLISDGMTEDVEDQLILMANHLHKVCRHYNDAKPSNPGKVILDLKQNIQCYTVTLSKNELPKPDTSATMRRATDDIISGSGDDWKVESTGKGHDRSPSHNTWDINHCLDIDYSTPEKSFIQYRCAPCRLELRELIRHREGLHRALVFGREWNHKYPNQAPPGWRIRPALVSHLHGHSAPVNRLVSLPTSSLLASCSGDGCIRIWDCGKMEGRNIANRARQVYNCGDGALVGMTLCNNNSSLAVASHSGQIILLRIDSNTNKIVVRETRQLDLNEEGSPVDIAHFDSGSQSVLVYATIYGCIIGWDLRSPGIAWKLDNDLKLGVVTAMLMDSRQCCLSLGTSSGFHTSWDLRFHLPIAKMAHPAGARVRCLASHPTQPSWLISAVAGNNEVSLWGIESGTRQVVLWGSNAPPLSNSQMNSHSVCAMYSGLVDNSPFLLTGGTDHRIRYWNLADLASSYMVIPAGSDVPGHINFSYKSRLIDGTDVVQEIQTKCRQREKGSVDESPRAGPDQPATGHHNGITDMTLCHGTQCFMVTSDRDGVIKVWK